MDWDVFTRTVIAAIGFGAGGEALRRYRAFKLRRLEQPAHLRNAGFWTDRRIIRSEFVFACLALGVPFTVIIMAVDTNGSLMANYAALLAYPAAVFLMMRGLRARV